MENKNKFFAFLIYFAFFVFCVSLFSPDLKEETENFYLNPERLESKQIDVRFSSKILWFEILSIHSDIYFTIKDDKIHEIQMANSFFGRNLIPFMQYEKMGKPYTNIYPWWKKFEYVQFFSSWNYKKKFRVEIIWDIDWNVISAKIKDI